MENENHKKKIELMNSIMKNPKMARSFKDAMSSPIGSTKREQAKSVLSIMKKVGGLRNDGMGGPLDSMSSSSTGILNTSSNQLSSPSSYYIFPAAPSLKSMNLSLGSSSSNDANGALSISGSGTPTAPKSTNLFSGFNNIMSSLNTPKIDLSGLGLTLPNIGTTTDSGLVSNGKNIQTTTYQTPVVPQTNPQNDTALSPGQFSGSTPTTPTTPEAIKTLQSNLNTQNAGKQGWIPLKVDGIMGPKTTAAQTFGGGTPTTLDNTGTTKTDTTKTDSSNSGADTSFASSDNVFNIAATSVAKLLSLTPTTPLIQVPVADLASAIATNEGYFDGTSKVAIANNNPGNLKFANQPGATEDSRGFAVFKTADEGAQALMNDLTAKYNSGKYKTINDLMSVYSPDSDNPSNTGSSSTTSPTITKDSTGNEITTAAQTAVNNNTGASTFASTVTNAKFDGGLSQYINDLDTKLKTQFNLEPLETQLSNLKSESTAFIPTLTSYIQGKDQYSKAIDSLITKAEGQLTSTNMADPFTANQYTNYMNYLYTLKGRQNSRYSQYLNSAVTDYNADVTKTQNNYDTVYKRYTDALTQGGTLAQNEYNQLRTDMVDLYTSLDNAPTKANNLKIQQQQITQNDTTIAQNAITAAGTTNPDYFKDVDTLTKALTDPNATAEAQNVLDTNKLGAAGLAGFFAENSYAGSDPQAAAKAINNVFSATLANSTDKMADLAKLKKLVTNLSNTNGGAPLAAMISPTLNKAGYSTVSDYVLANIGTLKDAAQTLVSGKTHWFSANEQAGLKDEASWKKKFSNINSGVLDDLYNFTQKNITAGSAYEKDPSSFLSSVLFVGKDDNEKASNIASALMSTW